MRMHRRIKLKSGLFCFYAKWACKSSNSGSGLSMAGKSYAEYPALSSCPMKNPPIGGPAGSSNASVSWRSTLTHELSLAFTAC